MTWKINRIRAVVKVRAKYHQATCSSSWVIVRTSFFAISHNGEESENPLLWPWPLGYTLKFSGFRVVVKIRVHAKSDQTECRGSW